MSLLNDVMRDLQTRGVLGLPPLAGLQPVADVPQPQQKRHLLLPLLATLSVATAILLWGPGSDSGWVPSLARITGFETPQSDPVQQAETAPAIEAEPIVPASGNDLRELFSIEIDAGRRATAETVGAVVAYTAGETETLVESPAKDPIPTVVSAPVESQTAAAPAAVAPRPATRPQAPADATAKPTIVRRQAGVEDIGGIVMRAQRAMRGHDLVTAERLFREALAIDSGDATIWTYLYTVLAGSSRHAAAEQALRQGLNSADEPASLAKLYARLLVDRGDKDAAVSVLGSHRPAPAADTEYDAFLAALLQQTGSYADAGAVYRNLLSVDPDSGPWLIGLAMSDDSLGNTAEALAGFERAMMSGSLKSPLDRYARRRIAELRAND